MLLLLLSLPAEACGPYFDHPKLSWVGREMLSAPTSSFDDDVRLLTRAMPVPDGIVPRRVRTEEGDALDVLSATGDEALVAAYLDARARLEPAPDGVPEEFRRYQDAVLHLRAGRLDEAAAGFEQVLAMPADERQYRSTWAAYMLPMARWESGSDLHRDYARVQELAAEGYTDTLGLALASLSHQSIHDPDPGASLEACLTYRAAGGTVWCQHLASLTSQILDGGEGELAAAVERPWVAEVVGAWLTSHPDDPRAGPWLEAAERAPEPVAGADRLAWAAYQQGRFGDARRWAERGEGQPMAHWMRGKLALREGDVEAAAEQLQATTEAFGAPMLFTSHPTNTSCPHHGHDPVKAAHIELGIVRVATGEYALALAAFLEAGDWLDAAWVAERLLTTGELLVFVERWFPEEHRQRMSAEHGPVQDLLGGEDLPTTQVAASIRHLLARRLAREGRWGEAIPYFPYELQVSARQVRGDLALGQDAEASADERGSAQWSAAYRIKQQGFDLVATELEPDFRVLQGWYEGPDTALRRVEGPEEWERSWLDEEQLLALRVLVPTASEQALAAQHAPTPDRRYHWVWMAHELAWQGVSQMDDGNAELPQALCTAGKWQRHRDPASAERFLRRLDTLDTEIDRSWWLPGDSLGRCQPPGTAPDPAGCAVRGSGRSGLGGLGLVALLLLGRRPRR